MAEWEVVDGEGTQQQQEGTRRHNSTRQLRWLAELLDSRYNILGIRLGWDAILGLIPGFGDLATNIAGFYILVQGANLGAPPSVILRMGLNLLIDNLVDTVPLLGNILDIFWRANLKNVALLERYMADPHRTTVGSRWVVGITLAAVFVSFVASIALTVWVAALVLRWLFASGGNW